MRHPVKIKFMQKNRKKIPNPNPKGKVKEVWGAQCSLTGVTLPLKDMEVDHVVQAGSLANISDIQTFVEGLSLITEDDLAFVSKEAHKIKTLSDRQGISFEEARAIKQAIEICKTKQDKKWLEERGIEPASNAAKRRVQIEEELKKNEW